MALLRCLLCCYQDCFTSLSYLTNQNDKFLNHHTGFYFYASKKLTRAAVMESSYQTLQHMEVFPNTLTSKQGCQTTVLVPL